MTRTFLVVAMAVLAVVAAVPPAQAQVAPAAQVEVAPAAQVEVAPAAQVEVAPVAPVAHERLAGPDRIATAVMLSRAAFPEGSRVALVARADAFADALAAAGLAGVLDAPVLLSTRGELPAVTAGELRRLGVHEVIVLGSAGAIDGHVEQQLRALGLSTQRIGGADRFATAALVAGRVGREIGTVDGRRTAFLASGGTFPDALAAGPLAAALRLPILLTPRAELAAPAARAIAELGIEQVIVLGGDVAVSPAAEQQTGVRTLRLQGGDRTATAAAIARFAVTRLGFSDAGPVLARGDAFPDALAAASLAGRRRAPILLASSPVALGRAARDHLLARAAAVRRLTVLGGPAALSSGVVGEADRAARGISYVFPIRPATAATYGRAHHDYPATDIFAACGTQVVAPTVGRVAEVNRVDRWDPRVDEGSTRGGLSVALVGDDGVRYYGSHFATIEHAIQPGARVTAGQLLGTVGRTGSARPTPCHLHLGISPPCGTGDWQVRRGVLAPWPYLDAWRAGQHLSPVDGVRAWAAANPRQCAVG